MEAAAPVRYYIINQRESFHKSASLISPVRPEGVLYIRIYLCECFVYFRRAFVCIARGSLVFPVSFRGDSMAMSQ